MHQGDRLGVFVSAMFVYSQASQTCQDEKFSKAEAANALSELAKLHFENLNADDLHKLRKGPHEHELIIMAEAHAYFQIAYKVR